MTTTCTRGLGGTSTIRKARRSGRNLVSRRFPTESGSSRNQGPSRFWEARFCLTVLPESPTTCPSNSTHKGPRRPGHAVNLPPFRVPTGPATHSRGALLTAPGHGLLVFLVRLEQWQRTCDR
jgi:hypothetical protein